MLKVIILMSCLLGAMAAPKDHQAENRIQLMLEFKDFMVALPMQKMYTTLLDHMNNDLEMQAALKYVQGKEFRTSLHALMSKPSVKELRMKYIEAGLDLDRYEKMLEDLLSGMVISVPEDTNKSFGSYLADLDKLMPYDKLLAILNDKLDNSPVFIKFFNAITSQEMRLLFEKSMHSSEFKQVAQDLEDMDVPLYKILAVLFEIFGWKEHPEPNDL